MRAGKQKIVAWDGNQANRLAQPIRAAFASGQPRRAACFLIKVY